MTDELTDITGICPTVRSDEEAHPVYSEEYEEYVCSKCDGSLDEGEDRAVTQFENHAIKVERVEA